MNNNMSINRIHLTTDFNLVFNYFEKQDAGIYRCHGSLGQDVENQYNYRLEPIFQRNETYDDMHRGNLTDWEEYREINLVPVAHRFAVSLMRPLAMIRDAGVTLEVISEWTNWTPCDRCSDNRGIKTSLAQCRLKSRISTAEATFKSPDTIFFFERSPLLPCRSQLLEFLFPIVSDAVRNLPEFLMEQPCENCVKKKKKVIKDKFKYKKTMALVEGEHFSVICPDADLDSVVVWRKDGIILKPGIKTVYSLFDYDNENHVHVDPFLTLYFVKVTKNEKGNYTCYVDNQKMLQLRIYIDSNAPIFTEAVLRHMKYIGYALLMAFFVYCARVFLICKNRHKYLKYTYEMYLEDRAKKENYDEDRELLWMAEAIG
ncbi:uncharacterized protein LOC130672914 isoform X2 [Microplitis mediator]|uniref:uncharacterized protein LOC130672914 isoform X2 n=2 Tax=Microplitis mediator TaxID=375433 RepID=UPI002557B8A5|nr:uncharacterized protein LOC130672914 isoform X2 [Microplitis mediator]